MLVQQAKFYAPGTMLLTFVFLEHYRGLINVSYWQKTNKTKETKKRKKQNKETKKRNHNNNKKNPPDYLVINTI